MNKERRKLQQIVDQFVWLNMEQRAEVQDLLLQIEAVIDSASDVSVASATIRIYAAVTQAAIAHPKKMPDDDEAQP
jgi:hypothetical protein